MFVGSDGWGERAVLLLLLVAWAGFLFGGFFFGKADSTGARRMPRWTRMTSSLSLVLAGWVWAWSSRSSQDLPFAALIAVGMSLGFIGDLALARLLSLKNHVLGGMAAFGLGHVAYISAILLHTGRHGRSSTFWLAWLGWLAIGALAWYLVVYRGQRPTTLHRAALPYALLLASTAGFATGLALESTPFAFLALGAALFLVSDLILAARLFNDVHFPLIDDVVWLTYGPGQMLIVYAVGAALRYR